MSFLRRLKMSYWLNNLLHRKTLLCNEDIYKQYGIKKSVVDLISSKDMPQQSSHENVIQAPWLDNANTTSNTIKTHKEFANFSEYVQQQVIEWGSNGYAILPQFYSSIETDTINDEVERLLNLHQAKKRLDDRIIFAIHDSEKIYNCAIRQDLLDLLSFILGRKVKLFQSLNFKKGSAQLAHSDTIHMTTYPLGYMIAVWVALEDIDADSGPLFYYPGSHKLPYVLNKDFAHGGNYLLHGKKAYQQYEAAIQQIIINNNFEKKTFLAKKGDVFIWHANILHGGEPIINPTLTRKSMVLHYYAEDVVCYHEITQRPAIFGGKEAACAVVASEG